MIFDLLTPPQECDVARPIHVNNSHIKFGWTSSDGLRRESMIDGQTAEVITIFPLFLLSPGKVGGILVRH